MIRVRPRKRRESQGIDDNLRLAITTTWLSDRLLFLAAAIPLLTIIAVIILGYQGKFWTETISFRINDSWCNTGREGVGLHCFGDYGLAYYRGYKEVVYSPDNFAAANTPVTALFFELLRLFPYNISLVFYLALSTLCLAYPIFKATAPFGRERQLILTSSFGLLSAGAISALDRGNHVALLVPLVYWYIMALAGKKWTQAWKILALVGVLKFWGLIFAVGLIFNKRFKEAIFAFSATFATSLAALVYFPGEMGTKITSMKEMVLDRDYSNSIAGFSLSLSGLARRTACAISTQSWCNTKTFVDSFWSSVGAVLLVTLFGFLTLLLCFRAKGMPSINKYLVLATFGFLLVPDAPRYNTVFAAVVLALLVTDVTGGCFEKDATYVPLRRDCSLWFMGSALVVTLVPTTLYSNRPGMLSSGTGDSPVIFRSDFWLVPLAWLLVYLTLSAVGLTSLAKEHKGRETEGNANSTRNTYVETKD